MIRRDSALRPTLVAAAALLLAAPVLAAPPEALPLAAQDARIHRAADGALTGPSTAPPGQVVADFVRARRGQGAAVSLVARSTSPGGLGGVTHLRYGQRVAGLDVYGTYVKASVDSAGRLVSLVENLSPAQGAPERAAIGADKALSVALEHHYPGLRYEPRVTARAGNRTEFDDGAGFFWEPPSVTRVAVPLPGGALAEGFLVETWTEKANELWHTVVGGDGAVLYQELRTNTDTYKIYLESPGAGGQTVVAGPGSGNAESPIGWVTSNTTIGNNVDAYLDRDNNNSADSGGRPTSSTQTFEWTYDPAGSPTGTTNQYVAVTNLFFLNNVIHDKLYAHGFTEAAGNFQSNNFGRGGAGNDPVRAEAQDGGGTNNANFSTPADGSRPRMQMYLWTFSTPNRDGDLDADIVWHEYGHGLTWRMIGNMSGPFAGAIGEGMSDVLAIYTHGDDVVGEWSYNNLTGIRRYAYTGYPLTYGDHSGSSVHNDGEIYAAAMWKLRELWTTAGYTEDELWDVMIDGMNYTPSRPAYEDMRDGLLASSPTQAKDCVIWDAFAELGIGVGANGTESCFWIFCSSNVTESFTKPAVCS
ncbi:MAG TPA: M36 family metallopeptidase [Thermoanaerobaculia bacterium]|nr:M36 family metallopeptidase [Thermoanaerobaculia bacterium]